MAHQFAATSVQPSDGTRLRRTPAMEDVEVRLMWPATSQAVFSGMGMVLRSWADADGAIRELARQVPDKGFEEVAFAVTWASTGDTYHGVFAVRREDEAPASTPLSSHVWVTLAFLGGVLRPLGLPLETYRHYLDECGQQRPDLVALARRLVEKRVLVVA